jgi:hypothetical protein
LRKFSDSRTNFKNFEFHRNVSRGDHRASPQQGS